MSFSPHIIPATYGACYASLNEHGDALAMKAAPCVSDGIMRFPTRSLPYQIEQLMTQQHHRNLWHVGNNHQRYEIQQQKW